MEIERGQLPQIKPRRRIAEIDRPLVLTAVCERDIDLLLAEELLCSTSFQRIVFETVAPLGGEWVWSNDAVVHVRHSVAHSGSSTNGRVVPPSGETDIEVVFDIPALHDQNAAPTRFVCLIENKIEAAFMPRQPERYIARALTKRDKGECTDARALIVAPTEYLAKVSGVGQFHATLSYEQIAAYFADQALREPDSEASRRYSYREATLHHAIGRFRRGYRQATHPGNRSFRHEYHRHAALTHSVLRLQEQPDHVWEGDEWMEFRHALKLTPMVRADIVHKMPQGTVDLQLRGWARHQDTIRPLLTSLLEIGMHIPPVNPGTKSLMVMIPTPAIIPQRPFQKQVWKAELGMQAAERLQSWYHLHADVLETIAARIA